MSEVMSKKERMARQAAAINVIKVNPRPGNFCKYYVDPTKMPKAPQPSQSLPQTGIAPRPGDPNMAPIARYRTERPSSNFLDAQPRRGAPM